MNNLDYPYKAIFAADLSKISNEDIDKYISKASLEALKPLMPANINLNENKDLIGCLLNAAVAGRRNANGDSITNKTAIRVAKNFINKYVNLNHKRDLIKGCIVNYGFSKFGTDELITEKEAEELNEPFNISLAFILWKTTLNDSFIQLLEKSVDPTSDKYKCISGSWEIIFKQYDIAIGNKNINDSELIVAEEKKKELEQYLQANGGTGKKDNQLVYRVIKGETDDDFLIPTGIGLTENPAADVKGLEIIMANNNVINNEKIEANFTNIKDSVKDNENNNEKITFMDKITKIQDITDESIKTIKADVMLDFINTEIKKADDLYKAEQGKSQAAEKSLADTQKELDKVKASLEKLEKEAAAKASQETFTQRMTYFDDTYELSKEERQAIAGDIGVEKGIDEDAFKAIKDKYDIFLKDKSKASIQAKKDALDAEAAKKKAAEKMPEDHKEGGECSCAKCKTKASKASTEDGQAAIDDALKNGSKSNSTIPNAASTDDSFEAKWAKAFSIENCISVSK